MHFSVFSVQDHHPASARSVPELYDQVLEQGVLADELGYDSFFVAEHHFHEYGVVPNPAVFLSSLAQLTKSIKLGPAISILTFHNPLTVAENYAMLNILAKGRLVLGVGSGYLKHEFEGFGISPEEKRARFDENLAILKQALSGHSINHTGTYNTIHNVKINVVDQPLQVPLYVAVLRGEAAYHVGRQGHHIICVPYASLDRFEEIGGLFDSFKKGYAASGQNGVPRSLFAFHAHVADTDEQARQNAEAAFDLYVRTRLYAKQQRYDDVIKSGLHLFGSPETVAAKILELQKIGIDHLLLLQNFGMMDPLLVKRSMTLFMKKVKPLIG